jgi:hypothetical protein
MGSRKLSANHRAALLATLEERFGKHPVRHEGIEWAEVRSRLEADDGKLWSVREMERTGGEPDVVGRDEAAGGLLIVDCSRQSPAGRRSICYDQDALRARKKHPPADSAICMASAMGIEMLTEAQYRRLQELGEFDTTTSSWVQTPDRIRALGGALFCDRRYDTVFVYHNGADSYYAARGFRGVVHV